MVQGTPKFYCTACNTPSPAKSKMDARGPQNGQPGGPQWPTGSAQGSNPRFLGARVTFFKISFFNLVFQTVRDLVAFKLKKQANSAQFVFGPCLVIIVYPSKPLNHYLSARLIINDQLENNKFLCILDQLRSKRIHQRYWLNDSLVLAGLPIQILAWGGQGSDGGDWHAIRDKINGTTKNSVNL